LDAYFAGRRSQLPPQEFYVVSSELLISKFRIFYQCIYKPTIQICSIVFVYFGINNTDVLKNKLGHIIPTTSRSYWHLWRTTATTLENYVLFYIF